MKNGIIIFGLTALFSCGSKSGSNSKNIEVNPSARDSFYMAAKLVDTTGDGSPGIFSGMTAIIIPERMGDSNIDFRRSKKIGFEMPCQCVFKNDSLAITSAIAWEGGFAYIAKASAQETKNSFMLFGKNKKWMLDGKEYTDEIEVPSLKNGLVISRPFPLKERERLYGWFDIETPSFFEITGGKEKEEEQQHIMRIYFSCQVSPTNLY